MNENYIISEFTKFERDHFIKVFSLRDKTGGKIMASLSEFSKIYGFEMVRQYSLSGVLLTHLLSYSDFKNWFNLQAAFSIYAAINEGTYGFDSETLKKSDLASLQKQFGPRQYLRSFPAFSIFAPINFYHLACSVNTFVSSTNRMFHSIDQSLSDLQAGHTQQILIAASNIQEGVENLYPEGIFFIATNSIVYLKYLFDEVKKASDEGNFYAYPIDCFNLDKIT